MDLQFWSQFCTSPIPEGASDISDLDSSPGWSPLSALEDQENFCSPGSYSSSSSTSSSSSISGTSPHTLPYPHLQPYDNISSTDSTLLHGSPPSLIPDDHHRRHHHHHLHQTRRSHSKNPVKRVQQRTAANHRERKRMKTINEAFEGLRCRVPLASGDRKLSKVDTLRLAIRYIHHLSDMVTACGEVDGGLKNSTEPDATKVIIRCHGNPGDYGSDMHGGTPLYGHSLSWTDEKETKVGPNGRLVAKLWMPESADPTTLQHTTSTGNYDCDSIAL